MSGRRRGDARDFALPDGRGPLAGGLQTRGGERAIATALAPAAREWQPGTRALTLRGQTRCTCLARSSRPGACSIFRRRTAAVGLLLTGDQPVPRPNLTPGSVAGRAKAPRNARPAQVAVDPGCRTGRPVRLETKHTGTPPSRSGANAVPGRNAGATGSSAAGVATGPGLSAITSEGLGTSALNGIPETMAGGPTNFPVGRPPAGNQQANAIASTPPPKTRPGSSRGHRRPAGQHWPAIRPGSHRGIGVESHVVVGRHLGARSQNQRMAGWSQVLDRGATRGGRRPAPRRWSRPGVGSMKGKGCPPENRLEKNRSPSPG